jgi:hypothetical protein
VVSRLTHGGAGTFDLTLSTASRVVEPRSDGSGNFTIVFNFDQPVTNGGATFTGSGGGSVSNVVFAGNSMIVSLAGVTDQQTGTVTVNSVSGPGTATASASVQIGFLDGDATGDGVVNVGDTAQVRNHAGETLDNTNFRNDINTDGLINVGDTIIVRTKSGDFLP